MKKLYATTISAVASIIVGVVIAGGLGSAWAAIMNPPRAINTSTFATTSQLASYLPLAGGTLTGQLLGTIASMSGNFTSAGKIKANNFDSSGSTAPVNGFTQSGANILSFYTNTTAAMVIGSTQNVVFNQNASVSGSFEIGNYLSWGTEHLTWNTASASLRMDNVEVANKDKCLTIPYKSPTSTNEFGAIPFTDGGTLTSVTLNLASGSNAVGWNLKYGFPNAVTTAVFSANKSASASATIKTYTTFANSTIGDGQVLNFVITSASATIEDISIGACYRK